MLQGWELIVHRCQAGSRLQADLANLSPEEACKLSVAICEQIDACWYVSVQGLLHSCPEPFPGAEACLIHSLPDNSHTSPPERRPGYCRRPRFQNVSTGASSHLPSHARQLCCQVRVCDIRPAASWSWAYES